MVAAELQILQNRQLGPQRALKQLPIGVGDPGEGIFRY